MDCKHSLHTFVHRTLVYRLIGVGLALSLLIGLTSFFIERDRVSQQAIDIAVGRVSAFSDRYGHLIADPENLEPEKIHQAIIKFRSAGEDHRLGSFVFIAVYDIHGKVITKIFDEQQDSFDDVLKSQIPGEGIDQYEIIRVATRPYLKISLPLINQIRNEVGAVNAIFAFSDETLDSFRWQGLRAMIIAIAIVLLTTAILYPVILRLTRRLTRFSVQLLDANLDTLETLGSAIAQRDSDTNAHNYRVSIYAVLIAEEVGLSDKTMRTLIKGAFLHDVGKIGIPDEILWKPGKLDDKEFEIMKTHVEQGREIIQRSKWLGDALEVVLSHHEKMTGKGYPMGLAGDGIPVTARIFAIADVFDALTSKRPYKEAWSFEEALGIMEEGRGTHFDPLLLDVFIQIAKPLYDKFGGKETIFSAELAEIIAKYFHDGMGVLDMSETGD
jgi:HD-GYP domain-containing protein (c-di-GMP phosphodiesterase class II)